MPKQIIVPNLGNEVLEAEVMEWMIEEGQVIRSGEVVVTISTSKTRGAQTPFKMIIIPTLVCRELIVRFYNAFSQNHICVEFRFTC